MRTTIRIDDELLERLRSEAAAKSISLNRLLNQTLRKGLAVGPSKRKKFVQKAYHMGVAKFDITKTTQTAAEFENEEIIRKMNLGK